MASTHYSLETVLAAFTKIKKEGAGKITVAKRTLFNQAPLGGLNSTTLVLFFFSLPFLEYAAIFNPLVFNMMGIAQSIIFYIVFMSIIMIIIFGISWKNNQKVIKMISPSWDHYFPAIELKLVLSQGATPYRDFFHAYSAIASEPQAGEALHSALLKAFAVMREDNADLLEAMERSSAR